VRRELADLLRCAQSFHELLEQGMALPSDRNLAERLTHHRQRVYSLTSKITD
jgi:hypothetical protein